MAHSAGGYVVRFTRWAIFQHAAMIVLFAILLITGLPQKWPYADASRWLVDVTGGIFVTRWLHRVAGLVFAFMTAVHVVTAAFGVLSRRVPPSMMLERKDFTDAIQNLRYCLGRDEPPPRFGRYDYRQKFEYWGLIFGSAVMIVSGIILMYPIAFSQMLPAQLIPAAKMMHSWEALLAFLIVLVWHMYGAHLNPDVFPFDDSMFTGRISVERMQHEHPLEWEELQKKR